MLLFQYALTTTTTIDANTNNNYTNINDNQVDECFQGGVWFVVRKKWKSCF